MQQVRLPIVTILGHVDHGKTSLLDYIRKANVVAKEHGGITQAIGAYKAEFNGKLITFIDTPGHAAFEKMRSRGAKVADLAVLVVAIDDGVMPQTVEAIKHILAAKVPMIVAVNKIDMPDINHGAQLQKIKKQLSDDKVLVEEYGGDVPIVEISAKTGEGVDKLLEMILLVAEVNELKGDPSLPAQGVVIESRLDKFKGPVATVIIRNGTLYKNEPILVGGVKGKIRGLISYDGLQIGEAGPSTPVEILGLESVPAVGSVLGEQALETQDKKAVLSLVDKLRQDESKILPIIVKADAKGSLEAIEDALNLFNSQSETVKIISSGTGDITEADVKTAAATKAIIIGFNSKISHTGAKIAETEHVLVRTYTIIYELLDELKDVIEGMLAGELQEEVFGRAQVLAEFPYGKNQKIAGCRVLEGTISKGPKVRLVRNDEIVAETKVGSIKKVKEEVPRVSRGEECGIMFDPAIDFKVGDLIQSFRKI